MYFTLNNIGMSYEDIQVPIAKEWYTLFKKDMLFGQVPKLQDGDFCLYQSKAILRYVGRIAGIWF
jgi:glutathione S-transferase